MAQFTKTAIIESFLRLLGTHSIEKITVKDIVEDCGVNRKTFYYYFKDIYDLTEYVFRASLERFAAENVGEKNVASLVTKFFAETYENRRVIMHVFNSSDRQVFEGYVYNVFNGLLLSSVRELAAGRNVSDEDIALIAEMYSTIFSGFLFRRLREGIKYDSKVNETVERTCAMISGSLELLLANAEKLNEK